MPGGCYSAANNDDGGDTAWSRWSKLIAVCLALLCVVLLIVVIVLSKENVDLKTELKQGQCERVDLEKFLKQGWIYFNSSVYINNEQKNWTESRKSCRERGADLVIINSREKQGFVNTRRGNKRAWIGLSNRENKWKWVDDTTLIPNTGFWEDKEPNSAAGDRCVITGKTSDPVKNWGDVPCSEQYISICEKKIFNSISVCE